jgi:hypothetical protein
VILPLVPLHHFMVFSVMCSICEGLKLDAQRPQYVIIVWEVRILLSILMACVICLQFSRQEEDILEHTNGMCHVFTI